jgi:putative DNA primase/helicase
VSIDDHDRPVRASHLSHALARSAEIESGKQNGRSKKERNAGFERSDVVMSDALARRYKREIRYCAPLGGWHCFTGTHWALDEQEHATECIKAMAREIADHAADSLDPALLRDAKRIGSGPGTQAILKLTRSAPGVVFSPQDANRDPWLLNLQNGSLDLRTGEFRAHRRDDLITRCCPVDFDANASAPTFEKFLAEIQPKQEIRDYLARLFGYAATGVVREHVLGVLWGPGANGKSVLADVVSYVLGDHAKPGPSSLIVHDGKHTPHPTDVASCAASRLVIVHETKRGASFDASKVKLLTGGDKLTARYMRQDFLVFEPTHTLVMLSNYKPEADANDAALWRRVQLVPFDVVIPDEKQDHELADKIKAGEAPGVLHWIVEGALQWQAQGLNPPETVKRQTADYRAAEDVIGQFVEECCVKNKAAKVGGGNLYAAFKDWCVAQGVKAVRGNDFSVEIQARGFRRDKTNRGAVYHGIGLHAAEDDYDDK